MKSAPLRTLPSGSSQSWRAASRYLQNTYIRFSWFDDPLPKTCQDVKKGSIKTAGKVFLLTWKFFTSKIVREFTLMSAPSFGEAIMKCVMADEAC